MYNVIAEVLLILIVHLNQLLARVVDYLRKCYFSCRCKNVTVMVGEERGVDPSTIFTVDGGKYFIMFHLL